jgi:hypothetical protein
MPKKNGFMNSIAHFQGKCNKKSSLFQAKSNIIKAILPNDRLTVRKSIFRGGLEGQSPSSCAAGAIPTTNPAHFRRIQHRKERSQYHTPIKLIFVQRYSLDKIDLTALHGIVRIQASRTQALCGIAFSL